jgi:hypothetical protein
MTPNAWLVKCRSKTGLEFTITRLADDRRGASLAAQRLSSCAVVLSVEPAPPTVLRSLLGPPEQSPIPAAAGHVLPAMGGPLTREDWRGS